MPAFNGHIKINLLYDTLVAKMKDASVSSLWTVINETAGSNISLKSVGVSGTDNIYVKIDKGTSKNATGNTLTITVSDIIDVSGVVGTYTNTRTVSLFTAVVDTNLLIDYDLSVTKDRIILGTRGDIYSNGSIQMVTYIGLPKRYSTEAASMASCIGVSYQGDNGVRTLQDINGTVNYNIYQGQSVISPLNPGWGTLYNANPIILTNPQEGARGELIDILALPTSGVNQGDTITINGVVYTVYILSVNGSSFLPSVAVGIALL
jgi:hypothetical protein